MANLYDNDSFFAAYGEMPRSKYGLDAAGEWHQLKALFPPLEGKKMLDLGCGYGWHCSYGAQQGATVLGVDGSQKMIQKAVTEHAHDRITYRVCSMEAYDYPENTFDFVLSNLALHYVRDLEWVYGKVYRTLKPGGSFVFNIEHPVFTAGVGQQWICDEAGKPLHWPVDDYYFPGTRETIFLGQRVKKEHHTLTQIIDPLLQLGFRLERLQEATPPEKMMDIPGMADELRRPMMLLVKAVK